MCCCCCVVVCDVRYLITTLVLFLPILATTSLTRVISLVRSEVSDADARVAYVNEITRAKLFSAWFADHRKETKYACGLTLARTESIAHMIHHGVIQSHDAVTRTPKSTHNVGAGNHDACTACVVLTFARSFGRMLYHVVPRISLRVAMSGEDDVANAVAVAEQAFGAWSGVTAKTRAAVMFRFHALLEQHADELVRAREYTAWIPLLMRTENIIIISIVGFQCLVVQ